MDEWEITDEDWPKRRPPDPREQSVLIVDDDPSIRSMLGFVFDDEGFEVREAADGVEAVAALEAAAPDAMILDLMMPRLDGHGVLRQRRDRDLAPDTRIVVLTAKADPADALWSWELGVDEYVTKPVDPEELLRQAVHLLHRTPEEIRRRRESGLAEARRLDAVDAAVRQRRGRR